MKTVSGRVLGSLLGLALIAAVPVVTATPALAAEHVSCAKFATWVGWGSITNKCKTTKRLKGIVDSGTDTKCETYSPGQKRKYFTGIGFIEKVVAC
ncbi:hypothetical protein NLX83_25995 [Allokutzneria sp. A3M-2-11 16]|uniref:hypothetical protein n=1 Tax=Allokutzneria sp. A3M-2-11 16 TaxID=2962043 RepID=UPI0020B78567|nr:hypothetical protein [Allokutzneria sp. A3M-2-11 16]MCP3802730.1 hypothetical protein [Allokutzneria sp. A3M-2-11 16]